MRRKRAGGIWLPPSPYDRLAMPADTAITNVQQVAIGGAEMPTPANGPATSTNLVLPLIGDFNQEAIAGVAQDGPTMADMTYGYSLKRIVGNLFIGCTQNVPVTDSGSSWVVTAGIMVRRTQDTGAPAVLDTFVDTYAAWRDPWVFRRSWIIQNKQALAVYHVDRAQWPVTNVDYNNALCNHRVDQKTRRTVKSEERLFLSVTVTALDGLAGLASETVFDIIWDLRFFGRVFQSAGNRNNASR